MIDFSTLHNALLGLKRDDLVFAVDKSSSGSKKFCVGAPALCHASYSTLVKNSGTVHWYEALRRESAAG